MLTDLVAGSYERFLFGFHIDNLGDDKATVKCVALHGPYMASGGNDDQIHLYNIQRGKDLGFLINPGVGAITALSFVCQHSQQGSQQGSQQHTASHILSGSADGTLMLWKASKTWDALKSMKGHKSTVNSVAVHPTGALALSAGRDKQLMLWNLVRGKCAYHTKLPEEGLVVQFTPSTTPHDTNPPPNTATAQRYTLLCPHRLAVHDLAVEGGHGDGIVASWQLKHASQCVGWMHGVGGGGEGVLLVGSDDGGLRGYDPRVGGEAVMYVHKAHAARVKGITAVHHTHTHTNWLAASACSNGQVKLWDVRKLPGTPVHAASTTTTTRGTHSTHSVTMTGGDGSGGALAVYETGARITCLAAAGPPPGGVGGTPLHEKQDDGLRKADSAAAAGGELKRGAGGGVAGSTRKAAVDPVVKSGMTKQHSVTGRGKQAGKEAGTLENNNSTSDKPPNKNKKKTANPPGTQQHNSSGQHGAPHPRPSHKAPPLSDAQRQLMKREGVVRDGVVEFPDDRASLRNKKRSGAAKKRKAHEGGMPSLEDAEQAALEMGFQVDVHEQHAAIEEERAREAALKRKGGKKGKGAARR